MHPRQNCWEVLECGRQPGGVNADELGVCPAATNASLNGLNGGHNAGRFCWAVTGTLCNGEVCGTFAQKQASCLVCPFLQQVRTEEGHNFLLMRGQISHAHVC